MAEFNQENLGYSYGSAPPSGDPYGMGTNLNLNAGGLGLDFGSSSGMSGGSGGFGPSNWGSLGSGIGGLLGGFGQVFGSQPTNTTSYGMNISPQQQSLQQFMMNMLYGGMQPSQQQTDLINKIKQGNIQQGTQDINAQRDLALNQNFQQNLARGMGASAPEQYGSSLVNQDAMYAIADLINQQNTQAMQQQLQLPYMTGQYGASMMNQMNQQAPRFQNQQTQGGSSSMLGGLGQMIGPIASIAGLFA